MDRAQWEIRDQGDLQAQVENGGCLAQWDPLDLLALLDPQVLLVAVGLQGLMEILAARELQDLLERTDEMDSRVTREVLVFAVNLDNLVLRDLLDNQEW